MKHFLPFIFILIAQLSLGQNWAPINLNSKYNYQVSTASQITNTIWVDSVEVLNSDSTFYLNRIVKFHSACGYDLQGQLDTNSNYCDDCVAWKNQPQFLQRKVTKQANGNYHFTDSLSFVINPNAQLNDTWLLDTTNSVTATISQVAVETIFGSQDSVKTISLSNSGVIKLSKTYGIIYFDDQDNPGLSYDLVGMEDPDLGEIVPNYEDIFDFEVGGTFCWFYESGHAGDGEFHKYTDRVDITYKNVDSSGVTYETQGYRLYETMDYNGWHIVYLNPVSWTYTYFDSTHEFYNGYNNQLFEMTGVYVAQPAYHYVRLNKLQDGRYQKVIGGIGNPWTSTVFVLSDSIPDLLLPSCGQPTYGPNDFQNYIYEEGKGKVYSLHSMNFEGSSSTEFSYSEDVNDSSIYCLPYSMISIISGLNEGDEVNLKLSPNPATDRVELSFTEPLKGEIIIYNQTGQVVHRQAVNSSKQQIDVSMLPSGLYLLNVRGENYSAFEKLVITR